VPSGPPRGGVTRLHERLGATMPGEKPTGHGGALGGREVAAVGAFLAFAAVAAELRYSTLAVNDW